MERSFTDWKYKRVLFVKLNVCSITIAVNLYHLIKIICSSQRYCLNLLRKKPTLTSLQRVLLLDLEVQLAKWQASKDHCTVDSKQQIQHLVKIQITLCMISNVLICMWHWFFFSFFLKKGFRRYLGNYRSVSLTSVLSKSVKIIMKIMWINMMYWGGVKSLLWRDVMFCKLTGGFLKASTWTN